MAAFLFTDPRIQNRWEELNFCRQIVDFFLYQKPWADEYQKVSRLNWYLLLQARFPNQQGEWFNISEPDFLEEIEKRLESETRGLDALESSLEADQSLPPTIPPNLQQLVAEYETAKNKKEQGQKIEASLWHHWELTRNRSFLNQELKPQVISTANITVNRLQNLIRLLSLEREGLLTSKEKLILGTSSEASIQKALRETFKERKNQPIFHYHSLGSRLNYGHEKQVSQEIESIFKQIVEKILIKAGVNPSRIQEEILPRLKLEPQEFIELKAPFQDLSHSQDLETFTEDRLRFLEEKASNPDFAHPSALSQQNAQNLQIATDTALSQFILETFESDPVRQKLEEIGINEEDRHSLTADILADIQRQIIDRQNPALWTMPEKEASQFIQNTIQSSFAQNLRRAAVSGLASALKNIILPSQRYQIINRQILPLIQEKISQISPALLSSLKAATLQNISAASSSLEEGHPYGRLSEIIKLDILATSADLLKAHSVDELLERLKIIRGLDAPDRKPLSESQIAVIKALFEMMKTLEKTHPSLASFLRGYAQRTTALSAARGSFSFFLNSPDYILHLPYLFGKMYLVNRFLREPWELKWKPRFISFFQQIPLLGLPSRFWYGKKDNLGLFYSLPQRIKKKVFEKSLRFGLKKTASFLKWLGQKLGKDKWLKLGEKLTAKALAVSFPAIGIIVAFWPQIKGAVKRIIQALGLWFIGLFLWAAQKGPWVLGGLGAGFVGGIPAGIFAGKATFAATVAPLTAVLGPITGPLAAGAVSILAGLAAWGTSAGLGAILGYFAQSIWTSLSSWLSSAFSSLFGTTAEMATAGTGVGAGLGGMNLAGLAAPVLGATGAIISGLYFYTQLVNTSSLLPAEGMEFLAGSKYIEIEKGVQVGEEADKDQFEDRYNLPNGICDPPAKTVYYQIGIKVTKDLTDIKITDKTTRTGEYGSVTVQEKSWSIDKLEKGSIWPPDPKSEVYNFALTPEFKDSYLSNTVTVTSAEGEEKTATLTLKIGNPPAPPLKEAVELLIDTLLSCYQTHQINQSTLTDNGQCLLEKQIPQSAVEAILRSIDGYTNLQCVGLVIAATQMAGQPLISGIGSAPAYYGKDWGNYKWHSHLEMDNIREGDVYVSAKNPGHLAVVDIVNPNGFGLAEAFGNDCKESWPILCKGYVRYQDGSFITFDQAKDQGEIGFLRWGE